MLLKYSARKPRCIEKQDADDSFVIIIKSVYPTVNGLVKITLKPIFYLSFGMNINNILILSRSVRAMSLLLLGHVPVIIATVNGCETANEKPLKSIPEKIRFRISGS